jgi:hypothetical protein
MNYALKYPRFWFWYLRASIALLVASYGSAALYGFSGRGLLSEVLGLVASTVAMWPLYGYVAQRRLAPRWLWLVVWMLLVLWLMSITLLVGFTSLKTGTLGMLLGLTHVWLVLAPQIFGIHQYVYRSPHIWQPSSSAT